MNYQAPASNWGQPRIAVAQFLNDVIGGHCIYEPERFQGIPLRTETNDLLKQGPPFPNLARLNRMLLEDAYPVELARDLKTEQAACHRCPACWCCYEPVYVDEREVDYMLESLSPEQFSEVTENTLRWLARAQLLLHQKMPCPALWTGVASKFHALS